MFAVDDGLVTANLNLADLLFLIAAIVFGFAALLPLRVRPVVVEAVLVPVGLCLTAFGFLVL